MFHTKAGLAALAGLALALAGCAAPAASTSGPAPAASTGATASSGTSGGKGTVTVVTHDSFALSKDVLASFTAQTGYELKTVAQGDAGAMVNQLILTKDAPLGDAVFGIDNTFASRAISAGILAPYASPKLPADAAGLKADDSGSLTPTDFGDVCVNADKQWFAAKNLALPKTLDDLTKPAYKGLLVVEHAGSSSPGLAFLAATVAAKGQPGYLDYWGQLKANGVKVVKGWTEAYSTEFSGGEGKGKYPLVVSYSSSPAFTLTADGKATTTASLDATCFRQIEYAGVLAGAKNPEGAKAFVDWMLSNGVQADIPGSMYMYPAVTSTPLPAEWATFGPLAPKPYTLTAAELGAGRDQWIKDWSAKVVG